MSARRESLCESRGRGDDYEPYVVSDERLAEIRAMFTERDAWDTYVVSATPGTTQAMLLGALVDLLGERDDREAASRGT